jgi:Acetyltransferase (GNAT) domain
MELLTDDTTDPSKLSEFLKKNPASLLYTSPAYLSLLGAYLKDTKQFHLRIEIENELVGYFPLVIKLNEPFGSVCNSLPYYGSNGGMIIDPSLVEETQTEIRVQLLAAAEKIMLDYQCVSSTIITNPHDQLTGNWIREHFKHDLVDERIGQLTPLPPASENLPEQLLQLFEDPRPRNIRRAMKEGMRIYHSQEKMDLDFLYRVHHDNITAIGGIAKEPSFFEKIPAHFGENAFRVYIAELNGEKIAALLLFYFNQTVEYFTPAVVEQYRGLQPTALIIYQAMLDAIPMGYRWWNWGGTWLSQGGVYDFKKKWGTQDLPYFYYTRIHDEKILSCTKEELLREYPFFFVAPFGKLKSVV